MVRDHVFALFECKTEELICCKEDAICENPNVASSAVIGIPDPKWGEMVVAYVQLKNGCQLSEETVINEVRHAKGAVATPKRVEFVQALPLTALV